MLVTFAAIFVMDPKIIFHYHFGAPLSCWKRLEDIVLLLAGIWKNPTARYNF